MDGAHELAAVFVQELGHIVFGDQHGLWLGWGHTDVAVYRLCGWRNRDIDMLGLRIPTLDGFSGDDRTVMDGYGIWLNSARYRLPFTVSAV